MQEDVIQIGTLVEEIWHKQAALAAAPEACGSNWKEDVQVLLTSVEHIMLIEKQPHESRAVRLCSQA